MCELCEENGGEEQSCSDCGRLICFETQAEDDVCAQAYVTENGDLYCETCGLQHDEAEERLADEGFIDGDPLDDLLPEAEDG